MLGVALIGSLALFGCTRGASKSTGAEVRLELIPESERPAPGVEVEVLAAQRGGRGDVALVFLLGRNGQVERKAGFHFRPPPLVTPPDPPMFRIPGQPVSTEDFRGDALFLSEEEAGALVMSIRASIAAASTPEVFDAPAEFSDDRRPWRRLNPPVRLRVNPNWFPGQGPDYNFDGTWVILASPPPPPPPATDRVVVNVVGWQRSSMRSGGLNMAVSRGFLPEAWAHIPLGDSHGPRARELMDAVRAHASDEVLPDLEAHGEETPWRAISGVLRVEVDRAWLEAAAGYVDPDYAWDEKFFVRWTIVPGGAGGAGADSVSLMYYEWYGTSPGAGFIITDLRAAEIDFTGARRRSVSATARLPEPMIEHPREDLPRLLEAEPWSPMDPGDAAAVRSAVRAWLATSPPGTCDSVQSRGREDGYAVRFVLRTGEAVYRVRVNPPNEEVPETFCHPDHATFTAILRLVGPPERLE